MASVIPVRQRQVGVAGGVNPPRDTGDDARIGEGLAQLGRALDEPIRRFQQHADELQLQHDVATAQSRLLEFTEQSLGKVTELRARKGELAKGTQAEYKEWHRKQAGPILSKLQNDRQRQYFGSRADQHLISSLTTLADHQAREHQRHAQNNLDVALNTAMDAVSNDPKRDEVYDTWLEEIKIAIADANPGVDNSARIQEAETGLKVKRLQSMTVTDPMRAKIYLERWREDLGDAYDEARDLVDREWAYIAARGAHPADFDKQEDYVKSLEGVSSVAKKATLGYIRAEQAEQERRDFEAKKQRRIDAENEFWAAIGDGDRVLARRLASDLDVDGGDFTEKERQALVARAQKFVAVTDPYKWRELRWDVLKGKFTGREDLWLDPRAAAITNEDMMKLESLVDKAVEDPPEYADALSDIEYTFKAMYADDSQRALKFLMFKRELLHAMDRLETEKGRALTADEVRALAQDNLEKREKVGPDKSLFEAAWEQRSENRKPFPKPLAKPAEPKVYRFKIGQGSEKQQEQGADPRDPLNLLNLSPEQ